MAIQIKDNALIQRIGEKNKPPPPPRDNRLVGAVGDLANVVSLVKERISVGEDELMKVKQKLNKLDASLSDKKPVSIHINRGNNGRIISITSGDMVAIVNRDKSGRIESIEIE